MTILASPEDSAEASRRRRHIRTTITMLLAVALLVIAGYVAWGVLTGDRARDTVRTATRCSPTPEAAPPGGPVKAIAARKVQANVYNATGRQGLATSVARGLEDRGFRIGKIANDPAKRKVTDAAQIRHGVAGRPAAVTLSAHLPGAVLVPDRRRTAVIDVAIGENFKRLATPKQAAATLRSRQPVPRATC